MRIAGNYTFDATREEVWSALNDPEVLARTIPGCQKLDQVGENEYDTTLKVGLQAVRGVYDGRVELKDIKPPESYTILVDGKGNNGFLKGEGNISLRAESENKTILDYGGEAQIGGKIASVGQRLIDGAAKSLINQSLKALAAQVEERRTGGAKADAAPETSATANGKTDTAEAPTPQRTTTNVSPTSTVQSTATTKPTAKPNPAPTPARTTTNVSPTSTARPGPPSAQQTVAPATTSASMTTHNTGSDSFERRTITVPEDEQLSDMDVARGMLEDFLEERPWAPWVVVAFLLGYILGRN